MPPDTTNPSKQGVTPPMQPQTLTTSNVVSPSTTLQPSTDLAAKKIKNAGQSTLALGVFLAIVMLISFLGVKSLDKDQQLISYIYLSVVFIASIYWIISGRKIKNNVNNIPTALKSIRTTAITAFVVMGITVLGAAIKPSGGGFSGILALILGVYLLIASAGIKKAS
jgi:hypothetical protein